ncbi:MAG: DUF6633 family protein [Alloprevotella sp.]
MTTTVFSQIINPTLQPDIPQEKSQSPLQKQIDTRQFLNTYSTDNQEVYAALPLKQCIDTAPSIQEARRLHGTPIVNAWINALIMNLCEFCGMKVTPYSEQTKSVAGIIMNEFGWLNAKELLVFFYRQKTGRYLTFYHTFDGSILLRSLRLFINERMAAARQLEEDRRKEELNRRSSKCVSYDEYRRMLEAGELDHLFTDEELEFFHRPPRNKLSADK